MLWELEQLEKRLREIEGAIEDLKREPGVSSRARQRLQAAYFKEQGDNLRRRQELLSHIEKDAALSKALDKRRTAEAEALFNKPRPEAERRVAETPGPVPGKENKAANRELYQAYAKQWHEKSVTQRANESAKMLEQEQGSEWEPS